MSSVALMRALVLALPLSLFVLVWFKRRGHRRRSVGALLAGAWNLPLLFGLNLLAPALGWWRFEASGGLLLGVPVDLLLAWSVLWGPLPALAFRRLHLALVLVLLLWLDLLLMPLCAPLVVLGEGWLQGEAAGLLLGALPALLLARWVRDDRCLKGRVSLGMLAVGGLSLGLVPAAAMEAAEALLGGAPAGPWSALSLSGRDGLLLQGAALAAVPGLSAVQEFCGRGQGTPLPYDPPKRLVMSGVYAYLANPMQVSMALVMLVWGALLGSAVVAAASLLALAYGVGLARWHEDDQLARRYGVAWLEYRGAVPRWWPRWRPLVRPGAPARLYVAAGCSLCQGLAGWILRRRPAGLEIIAAQLHPSRDLRRLTYDPGDGCAEEEGVAAFARALEHTHLGWAFLAWQLRLPGIRSLAQLLVDGAGGERRLVKRCALPGSNSE